MIETVQDTELYCLEKWSHRAIASIRPGAIFVMFFNESAFGVLSASRNLRPLQLFR